MLHGDGIVAGFESSDGVIAGAGGARHAPRVAIDIRYRDLRIGNHRAGHVKDKTRDGAGPDLREGASHTKRRYHKPEGETWKNFVFEDSFVFGHGGHPTPLKADSDPSMGARVSESGGSIKGLQPSGPVTRPVTPSGANPLKGRRWPERVESGGKKRPHPSRGELQLASAEREEGRPD